MASKTESTSTLIMQGDPSGLISSIQKVEAQVKGFEGGMANVIGTVGKLTGVLGMLAGVGSLGTLIKGSIDAADNMSKLSQKVGVNIEQLSGMAYAAELADVSTEQLGKGMGKLAKLMYEAAGDKDGGPAKTFQTLGISVTDTAGKLRNTDDVMMDVADRLAGMKDGAGKTALAMEVFGKGAADLIPLLNSGKKGIQEAADEARRFGLILTEEAGKQAEEFNDNLTRLKSRASGVAMTLANELLPGINALVDKFAKGGDIGNSPFMLGLHSIQAEFLRVAMLADKAGGSLTAMGMLLYGPGSAMGYKPSVERFEKMAAWNIQFEERYKKSEKAMQTMANLEVGLDADGNRFKPTGSASKGGGSDAPPKIKTAEVEKKNYTEYDPGFMNWRSEMAMLKVEEAWIKEQIEADTAALGSISESTPGFMGWKRDQEDLKDEASWIQTEIKRQESAAQAEFDNGQRMLGMAADVSQARLGFLGQEEMALQVHHDVEQQQIVMQAARELENLRLTEDEKGRIREGAAAQLSQLDQQTAQQRAQLWWNSSQQYLGYAQNMTTMAVQMLLFEEGQKGQIGKRMLASSVRFIAQGLQQYMFGKSKEHLLAAAAAAGQIQTRTGQAAAEMTIGATMAAAWAAFYTAMSLNPYGGQTFIPAATATAAAAAGFAVAGGAVVAEGAASMAAELGMAAAWGAGGIAVGALGEAGASSIEGGTSGSTSPAGYGGGSPGSPVVTQPISQTATPPPQEIHITVTGIITNAVVENTIIPLMNDAARRNIKLEFAQR